MGQMKLFGRSGMAKKKEEKPIPEGYAIVPGYKNPRRVPKGDPITVPVEHVPKTLQETLKEMVDAELRHRDALRAQGKPTPEDGLDDVDLLGDDEDVMDVQMTPAERDFFLAQLEVAAKVREKKLASERDGLAKSAKPGEVIVTPPPSQAPAAPPSTGGGSPPTK